MNARMLAETKEMIGTIQPPSEIWRTRAYLRLDELTKPRGSLGRLEDVAAQIIAIREEEFPGVSGKAVYVFAADHGIAIEGVSAYPREVTRQMVMNFLAGGAAINVLARLHHALLHVVDIGVDGDFERAPGLLHHKVARGSRNMLHEAAMSEEEMLLALRVGVQLAGQAAMTGQLILAIGEMGIGNTTAASVITCALTGASSALATGRGTGVSDAQHVYKIQIVESIMARHFLAQTHPLEILRCGGGLEIAAMTGMILAAAHHRRLIIIDGFISTAAAAIAVAIEPAARGYLFAGHRSEEPGHQSLLDRLQLQPLLSLGMRLGEGTGAVLAMPVLEAALCLYTQMATFASAGVSGESA